MAQHEQGHFMETAYCFVGTQTQNPKYDPTKTRDIRIAYRNLMDAALKENGFPDGICQVARGVKYKNMLRIIAALITPEQIQKEIDERNS